MRVLERLAASLQYPAGEAHARVASAAQAIHETALGEPGHLALAGALDELAAWIGRTAPGSVEERYSQLFDLSPVCTLNLGYHLFGESYERGALLAGLTRELAEVELEPGAELPDHLTNLLKLLARLSDQEDRALLHGQVLWPGLKRVVSELRGASDPFSPVLRALLPFLEEWAAREGLEVELPAAGPARLPVLSDALGARSCEVSRA